jgi:adenosine kinase
MKLIVTGSLSFDCIMSMPGRFEDYLQPDKLHLINVSFLMDTYRKNQGGTAGNQAYTLALLGFKPVIFSCAGKDFSRYSRKLESAGAETGEIRIDKTKITASGFCMTDTNDNQIWGFYSGAMAGDKDLQLDRVAQPGDFVLITPTEPRAMENFIKYCCQKNIKFLLDPAFQIPRIKQKILQQGVNRAEIIIGNDYEIALLAKRVKLNRQKIIITTLGRHGSRINCKGKSQIIPIARPKSEVNPTGAGDAYRAGFLAGYLKRLPLPVCGRMGALAAVYTVEKFGTQTHHFTLNQFKKRYQENFKQPLSGT